MKRNILQALIHIVLIFFCNGCKQEDNVPRSFSVILPFNKNPSGNWQVGYSLHDMLSMSQFRLSSFADTSHLIGLWHPTTGSSGYYPYIGQNRTTEIQVDQTSSWSAKPGEIVMEGSNNGQYSMLQFIVPVSGNYKLNATFEGVHIRLSSTDVHVLLNDLHLFDDVIDGYGGAVSFSAHKGSHPISSWTSIIHLNQRDILTFAIGYGTNMTFYNDTTGLLLTIEIT
jgi:hypothetical protein